MWKWRHFCIGAVAVLLGFIVLIVWICLRSKAAGAKVNSPHSPHPSPLRLKYPPCTCTYLPKTLRNALLTIYSNSRTANELKRPSLHLGVGRR
jgi:hypothetical protein